MGAGSALIPGSNDGLILLGMPLLFAHAWIAFAAMCAAVVFLMAAAHRLRSA
jgi:toxin CptA